MSILILAPHADDETLGMGGTISKYIKNGEDVHIAILTGPSEVKHPFLSDTLLKTIRLESTRALELLGVKNIIYNDLPPVSLDDEPQWKINKLIKEIILSVNPKVLYLPFTHDLHMDHKIFTYAANVACRPYLDEVSNLERVLAYETLSETDLQFQSQAFIPNVYIDITSNLDDKVSALKCYASQIQDAFKPRTLETIEALSILRGAHIGCQYAEAFVLLGEYIRDKY